MLVLLAVLAGFPRLGEAQQATAIKCETCGKLFATEARQMTDMARGRRLVVCKGCAEHPVNCAACGLPVLSTNVLQFSDGRAFCATDVPKLVREPRVAEQLWEQVKRECTRLLHQWPPLPDARITFKLVDRDAFAARFADQPTTHDYRTVLGLTHTRKLPNGSLAHTVYLLDGQLPAQFMATAAHEYAHAWLNERLSAGNRELKAATAEGICELVSWKVMDALGEAVEKLRIEQSAYTQGQFLVLLAAERQYRFLNLIDWIDRGQDQWLHPQHLDRLLQLAPPGKPVAAASPAPAWQPLATTPAPVRTELRLNGIMNTAKSGRVAIINGLAFTAGEQLSVKLGDNSVPVKCETIGIETVTVLVGADAQRQELRLGQRN
jgi:hypothetical protein